jgi:hypothetical protein
MRDTKEPVSSGAVASRSCRSHGKADDSTSAQLPYRVLLIDSEEGLSHTRSLFFGSLERPVDVTPNLAAIWNLPPEIRDCLVAVNLHSKLPDLPSVLTTVRSLWPAARIPLLGKSAIGIEDYQYDRWSMPLTTQRFCRGGATTSLCSPVCEG